MAARQRLRYWTEPALPGLALLRAELCTYEYAPHLHEALVLAMTEAGGTAFTSRGSREVAEPGAVLAFNPVETHGCRTAETAWRYRSFYLEAPALARIAGDLGLRSLPGFTRNVAPDPGLSAALLAAHRLYEAGETEPAYESLLEALGALFARHARPGPPVDAPSRDAAIAAPALRLARERHFDPLTLEELAHAAGVTPFRLIRACRRATGLTPHAWLVQARLAAARTLLRAGVPIVEAAVTAGFCDQSALHRHFRRSFGITPRDYARAERAGGRSELRPPDPPPPFFGYGEAWRAPFSARQRLGT